MFLDEPLTTPAAEVLPADAAPAAADPLSSLASSAGNAREQPGYHDLYQQQAAAQQRPVPVPAAAAQGGASLSPAPPRHRHADSLTLDGLSEIGGEEDAGYLYSGGALGGGGASGSGGGAAFGPSGGGAGGSSASTRPPPALELWVTDPVRRIGDSVIPGFTSTHYEYLVASSSEGARGRRRVEVRRRFKDFVVSERHGGRCSATSGWGLGRAEPEPAGGQAGREGREGGPLIGLGREGGDAGMSAAHQVAGHCMNHCYIRQQGPPCL